MSEDNGDASAEAGGPYPEVDGDAALPASIDPALAGRLDTMHRTLSSLGMRIDALVTSTTTYRTALADRLTEYADHVTKLTRTQAADLEEYRRANERTVAELRRGLASSEEVLERVGARIDSMLTDAESTDDQSRRVLAEVRSILDAQENLSRFLTESLDTFGARVLERIAADQAATAEQLEALRAALTEGDRHDGELRSVLVPLQERLERIDQRLSDTGRDEALVDRIAALDARLSSLAQQDPAAAVAGHLDTLHSAMELLATADQVNGLSSDVRRQLAKVDALLETSAGDSSSVARLLDEIRETLLDVASGEVVGALWDDFRATRSSIDEVLVTVQRAEEAARVAADQATTEPDGPDEGMEALRADVQALTGSVRDLLEQAEVVDDAAEAPADGMLTAIASDVSTLRRELSQGLVVEPSDALSGAVDQLRADVAALDDRLQGIADLQDSVSELRAAAAAPGAGTVDSASIVDDLVEAVDPQLRSVQDAITSLRSRMDVLDDLQESVTALRASGPDERPAGPPEATAVALRSMRDDLASLNERLDTIADLQMAVASLGDQVRANAVQQPATLGAEDLEGELATLRTGVDGVSGELRTIRSGVEDVLARLDEGLVLADAGAGASPPAGSAPVVDDQLATLRDQLTTEFDALRRLVGAGGTAADQPAQADLSAVTELLEHVRDDIAELPGRIEVPAAPRPEPAAPAHATVDPDVIDLLRDEIRAAGAVPDDLLDQLRKELISLRRRIKLRAEGEVFTEEQLEAIADAVARKLAT